MDPDARLVRPITVSIYPVDRHGLIRRTAALGSGFCDNELSAAVKRGELIRLIPGVFVENGTRFAGHEGRQELHRLKSLAAATSALTVRDDVPLSHSSAASVLGVPLLKPDLSHVHFVTGSPSGGSIKTFRHLYAAAIDADEVVEVDGIAVTCLERMAADVAVCGTFAQALVVMDQARRAGADAEMIGTILERRRRRRVQTARRTQLQYNPPSESVGESWSRAQMIEAGLPIPRLQHEFHIRDKTYESDFDWDERLIGEFDGLTKYGRLLEPGETPEDAVVREKRREDDLRGEGAMVVRWVWAELEQRQVVEKLTPWLTKYGLMVA